MFGWGISILYVFKVIFSLYSTNLLNIGLDFMLRIALTIGFFVYDKWYSNVKLNWFTVLYVSTSVFGGIVYGIVESQSDPSASTVAGILFGVGERLCNVLNNILAVKMYQRNIIECKPTYHPVLLLYLESYCGAIISLIFALSYGDFVKFSPFFNSPHMCLTGFVYYLCFTINSLAFFYLIPQLKKSVVLGVIGDASRCLSLTVGVFLFAFNTSPLGWVAIAVSSAGTIIYGYFNTMTPCSFDDDDDSDSELEMTHLDDMTKYPDDNSVLGNYAPVLAHSPAPSTITL